MSDRPVMRVERGVFSTMQEAMEQITAEGLWPTTYISTPSPELPLHWHDGGMKGYLVKGETYVLNEKGEREDLKPGDKLVIPPGSLHAEGTITDEVIYIVGLEDCRQFNQVLQMLDPDTYPEPELLKLDPDFATELFTALQAAAPPPPPIG